jgi:hypothetical protein
VAVVEHEFADDVFGTITTNTLNPDNFKPLWVCRVRACLSKLVFL